MMNEFRAVFKYPLYMHESLIRMHQGARILSVGVQAQELVVWALEDTSAETVIRKVSTINTGVTFSPVGEFVGTVTVDEIVWHIFDHGEQP